MPQRTVEKQRLTNTRRLAQWHLAVLSANVGPRTFHVVAGTSVRIGSNPGNDIVLSDSTVSRVHAEVSAEDGGVRVRDLGSTNGCWWQGGRVFDAVLPNGTVTIGDSHLTISPEREAIEPLAETTRFGPMVGQSASMRALFKSLAKVASSMSTVLIQAESGCGKELVARSLHEASKRSAGPYVVFDCAAAAPTLIESALFGHEKGAFTGATARKAGVFEEAETGTVFLDEIGELPLDLQPRLLRALENREIRRVGGERPTPIDVRVIAATHRDLPRAVNEGHFREDLYDRLAVVRLRVPPLRERLDDLRLLVEHLMLQALDGDQAKVNALLAAMNPGQWERLRNHPWPGNVRELRNAVDRSLAMADSLSPASDIRAVAKTLMPSSPTTGELDKPFLEQKQALIEAFEARYLNGMVERHEGNLSRAAAAAGIDRMYFKRLLKKYPRGL